ncbi:MAG: hypothetical protein ABW221_05470 [Vicinamibacteria bacterium]
MKTLALAAAVLAAATAAHAQTTLDAVGGTLYATAIDGARAHVTVRTSDGRTAAYDVVPQTASPAPIVSVSHTRLGDAVTVSDGTSNTVMFAFFRAGAPAGASAPFVLKDAQTGAVTKPGAVRTVALDPADPAATLIDAALVAFPGERTRAVAFVRRSSGEAVLLDCDLAGGAVRRTPLGFTPPIGSNKGSFTAAPDGSLVAALAHAGGTRAWIFHDILVSAVLSPGVPLVLNLGGGWDPRTVRVGIIAILIGLQAQPVPALSYQDGGDLVLRALDGGTWRTVARQAVPPQAAGFMEEEGISYYFLLPYLEQDNVYRGTVGQGAEPVLSVGH